MSRIGKKQIQIPDNVTVTLEGDQISVQGAKGVLKLAIHPFLVIQREGNVLTVKPKAVHQKNISSLWGLTRALVWNMIKGVTEGWRATLEVEGVGYRAQVQGKILQLSLGFSHPITFSIPEGIEINVTGNVIEISGIEKQLVNQTAAKIRAVRKPEPYKGTGIHYKGEVIKRKTGKKVAATTAA